jgi:DNA-binding NarL/FixJ family response regulator
MKTETEGIPALLLADDNPDLLATLVELLKVEYDVLAAFPNGMSVLNQIDGVNPDLVILDISLGDLTGYEVTKRLRSSGSSVKIIFLTVHEDIDFINAAFDIGVSGYVFKSRVTEDLKNAIDIVYGGGQFASTVLPSRR